MRVVTALGGNALLRRGQPMIIENQRENVATACDHLAPLAERHELLISHGNGPQIGLLALEEAAYEEVEDYPLDVLGAETQGMIGYLVEQELGNRLDADKPLATLLTMIEVDPADPAFDDPSKPIGPVYTSEEAEALAAAQGWTFRPDGDAHRRVVPSPRPKRIFEIRQIRWLLEHGCVVICAGGGGIPTALRHRRPPGRCRGRHRQGPRQRAPGPRGRTPMSSPWPPIPPRCTSGSAPRTSGRSSPPIPMRSKSTAHEFAAGSMLPKVQAASEFALATGKAAAIGTLADIEGLVAGTAGTRIATDVQGVILSE